MPVYMSHMLLRTVKEMSLFFLKLLFEKKSSQANCNEKYKHDIIAMVNTL